jgi:hypothetical protein
MTDIKKQPSCWKCSAKITKPNPDDGSLSLIGCKKQKDIHNYNDAKEMCPLILEK